MMNSRRICPADGSQYKVSAVGLVFMESAAGLAMETSKVESAVRNQAEAKLNQLEHTGSYQQMRREVKEMKRRHAEESADGLALITSSGDVIKISRWFESNSRKNQQMISRSAKIKTQRKNSAEAQSSSRHESAAKQLTIYESWMTTAEFKFKWRKRQEACKRKGHKYYSLSVLYRTLLNGKNFVSNGINLNRGYIFEKSAIEDVVGHCEAVTANKLIAQCTSRGKMNRKTKQSTAIIEDLSRESIAEF
ncbi:ethylene-responsive transcription factor 1B-like [Dorcoceras hygrometricum]|nr:ethylene-responsive transcription factor 1B-like [Dorcoceras hygrometricum]